MQKLEISKECRKQFGDGNVIQSHFIWRFGYDEKELKMLIAKLILYDR